jgi:shikimate kinase
MESSLGQRRKGLEEKIPDIKKTLSMVELLKSRKVSITGALDQSDLSIIRRTAISQIH